MTKSSSTTPKIPTPETERGTACISTVEASLLQVLGHCALDSYRKKLTGGGGVESKAVPADAERSGAHAGAVRYEVHDRACQRSVRFAGQVRKRG